MLIGHLFSPLLILFARLRKRANLRSAAGVALALWMALPLTVSANDLNLSCSAENPRPPVSVSQASPAEADPTQTGGLVETLLAVVDLDAEFPPTPSFEAPLAHHFGHASPAARGTPPHLSPDPRGLFRPPNL